MSIPQGVPTPVGAIAYPLTQPILGNPGPYRGSGGNLFIITTEVQSGGSPTNLVAHMSADNGQTYLNRVGSGIALFQDNTSCVFYEGVGDTVYVGYMDNADRTLKFTTLDISGSGSWGTPNASAVTIVGGGGFIGTLWTCKSASNVYIAWDDGVSPTAVNAVVWNGSAWSSRVVIATDSGSGIVTLPITVSTSGKAIIRYTTFGVYGDHGSGTIHYVVMNGSTVVSNSIEITFPAGDLRAGQPGGYQEQFSGFYDAATDSSVMPLHTFLHSTFDQSVTLLIVSPSAAPVFSLVTVSTTIAGINVPFIGYPWLTGNAAGDNFNVVWTFDINGGAEHQVQYSTSSSLTGPWSNAALYYDEDVNPPAGSPLFDGIFPIYANTLPDGQFTAVVGLTMQGITPAPTQWCGVMFSWPVTVPQLCPDIFVERQAQPSAPGGSLPPGACEAFSPNMPVPTYVAYDEPLELQGS